MYMRPNVNSVESSGHHLSARCSVWWQPAFGATRGSRGPSRAHRHLPLTLLLSGRRVCRTLQGTTGASLYYQRPSSGWILLHFWQSFSCHLRCSPLAVQSRSPGGTKLPSAAHTARGTQECLWPVAQRCNISALSNRTGHTWLTFHWTQRSCW